MVAHDLTDFDPSRGIEGARSGANDDRRVTDCTHDFLLR